MTGTVLGLGWAALVLGAGWRWRPSLASARWHRTVATSRDHEDRRHAGVTVRSCAPPSPSALEAVLGAMGHLLRHIARRLPDSGADLDVGRAFGAVVIAAFAAVSLGPVGLVLGLVVWAAPVCRRRREIRRARSQVLAELPEVVDLFLLAAGGGLNVSLAVGAVGGRAPPRLGAALRRARGEIGQGARAADALEVVLAPFGDPVRPLLSALVTSERYGAPLVPVLERLAAEVRLSRRRQAEEAARRVPVKLLFPLVLCVLPAFALLTVVPLLAGTLRLLPL